jgi:hypothetical protein
MLLALTGITVLYEIESLLYPLFIPDIYCTNIDEYLTSYFCISLLIPHPAGGGLA